MNDLSYGGLFWHSVWYVIWKHLWPQYEYIIAACHRRSRRIKWGHGWMVYLVLYTKICFDKIVCLHFGNLIPSVWSMATSNTKLVYVAWTKLWRAQIFSLHMWQYNSNCNGWMTYSALYSFWFGGWGGTISSLLINNQNVTVQELLYILHI